MSQNFKQINNQGKNNIPSQPQSSIQNGSMIIQNKNDNNIPSNNENQNDENKIIKRQSGSIQDRNKIENILNIDLQQNNKTNILLGQKNIANFSPNYPQDCLAEQNKFIFEKVEKNFPNREKVNSYQSATFRKGSETQNQIGQSSFTNLQNDLNNSQGLNKSNTNGRKVYKRQCSPKDNKDTLHPSQITTKQIFNQFKDSLKVGYFHTLLGLFKFAELYFIIDNKKDVENMDKILNEAILLYQNKFQGVKNIKTYDFQQEIDQYYHDISKRFTFQKSSRIGRIVERQACICEGKIKQPIIDKNQICDAMKKLNFPRQIFFIIILFLIQENNQNRNSILQPYKEKKVQQILTKIELRGGPYNFPSFKWVANPLKKFRIIFQDTKKSYLAVYTDTIEEAVKLRDYSICFSLEEQVKEFTPMGILRYVSIILRRQKIVQLVIQNSFQQKLFRHKLKEYAQYLENQKERVIEEVSIEESPQYKHVSITQQAKLNHMSGITQDYKPQFDHIQLEQLNMEKQRFQNLIYDDDSNSSQIMEKYFYQNFDENYKIKKDSAQLNHQTTKESQKSDQILQSLKQNLERLESNRFSQDSEQLDPIIQKLYAQKSKDFNFIREQEEDDTILEDEESNNLKTIVNQSISNQNLSQNTSIQKQQSNQSLNKSSQDNNSKQINNNNFNNNYTFNINNMNINNSRNNINTNNIYNNNINNIQSQNNQTSNGQINNSYFVNSLSNNNSNKIYKRNSLQNYQQMGMSQEQNYWEQPQSKILTFKSDFLNHSHQNRPLNKEIIKDYDQLFWRSFGEQLKMNVRRIADQQISFIKHKVQTMRESGDIPVDIFLTFHQIQFEFKNQKDQQDMIFKPKLRLQISEENDYKQHLIQFMVELQSRIISKKGKIKEFELFGEKKIAQISNVKLVKMKRNEIKIEIIDEITDSIIARNTLKMEKIISQTEFVNLQLTIEPVQLLSDKLIIQVHLQTFIQKINNKSSVDTIKESENQLQNKYDQNLKTVACDVPHNIEEYLEKTVVKQNYIIDNFYQCRIYLDRFTPSQFKIFLDLIQTKGINTTQLQVSLLKQNNKLECYQQIRVCLFKYYMEKQSQHQSLLAKNLSGWNQLYDDIVSQNEQFRIS